MVIPSARTAIRDYEDTEDLIVSTIDTIETKNEPLPAPKIDGEEPQAPKLVEPKTKEEAEELYKKAKEEGDQEQVVYYEQKYFELAGAQNG
jgi:hypothetical protein